MQEYNTIIGNLLKGINRKKFKRIVDKYNGDKYVKYFNCWSQFVCILIGQIANLTSLREITDYINFHEKNQYQIGIKKNITKSTLAEANEKREWLIYRDLFFDLVSKFQKTEYYQTTELIKIIDSTPINLKIAQHPWIETTMKVKGLKTHVVYDLTNETPIYFDITGARTNDITKAKEIEIEKGVTYIFDKGYTDYNYWNDINEAGAIFVTRLKTNAKIEDIGELKSSKNGISSQKFMFTNRNPRGGKINKYAYKELRKVIVERENDTPLILVTNDFTRNDKEIADLYKSRWQIELFFKWIKGNLKIKKFLGRSENAIKTQICIAMICFILLRMIEELKEICSEISFKNLLKIIGNNIFHALKIRNYGRKRCKNLNQLQFEWTLPS